MRDILAPRLPVSRADDEEAAEEARKQAQREEDQREREDFEARLRARDDEKTRKLMEARLSKEEMKARTWITLTSCCHECEAFSCSQLWLISVCHLIESQAQALPIALALQALPMNIRGQSDR